MEGCVKIPLHHWVTAKCTKTGRYLHARMCGQTGRELVGRACGPEGAPLTAESTDSSTAHTEFGWISIACILRAVPWWHKIFTV